MTLRSRYIYILLLITGVGAGANAFSSPPGCMELQLEHVFAVHAEQGARHEMLWKWLRDPATDGGKIIRFLSGDERIRRLYAQDAGVKEEFTIEQHTRMVFGVFGKQLPYSPIGSIQTLGNTPGRIDLPNLLKFVIALHDIGKPEAIAAGNKTRQHRYTIPIMEKMMGKLGFSGDEINIATALVNNDVLGNLAKDKNMTAATAFKKLSDLSKKTVLSPKEFFLLESLYYTADAASYPKLRKNAFTENKGALTPINQKYLELSGLFDSPHPKPTDFYQNGQPSGALLEVIRSAGELMGIAPEYMTIHPIETSYLNENYNPGRPIRIAKIYSTRPELLNRQIQYTKGQYLIYFKGGIYINQFGNSWKRIKNLSGRSDLNVRTARDQVWYEWDSSKGKFEGQRNASVSLIQRLFDVKDQLRIYRYGYPEEVAAISSLADEAKRPDAEKFLIHHLNSEDLNRPSHYGKGKITGYFYTSDRERVFENPEFAAGGRSLYSLTLEKEQALKLARDENLWVDMEYVDEFNLFTLDALKAASATLELEEH